LGWDQDSSGSSLRQATRVRSIQRSWHRLRVALACIGDSAAVAAAVSIAVDSPLRSESLAARVTSGANGASISYWQVSGAFVVMWMALLLVNGAYGRKSKGLWEQTAAVFRTAVGLLAIVGVVSLFLQLQLSRSYVVAGLAAAVTGTVLVRGAVSVLFVGLQRIGIGVERIILIGSPSETSDLRSQLSTTAKRTTRIVECSIWDYTSVLEGVASVINRVDRHGATSVVVCGAGSLPVGVSRTLAMALSPKGVNVVIAPGTAEAIGPGAQLHAIGDLFLLKIRDSQPSVVDRLLKSTLDRLIAAVALAVLSPVMATIAFLVRRDSPGPVLFRQERIGRNGRPFTILKFRSMASDAEPRLRRDGLWDVYVANGYKLPQGEDPRVTRLGATLRRTSLDELPQLLNVLVGSMSLVGPRPVVPKELECYGELAGVYTGVKPGVTGYWQVNGRSDVGFPERAHLDAYYYDNRSIRVDLRILMRTVVAVGLRVGAH
jgi:exopolysaccharide biosynthesis polyprenyl glycosylphosphotransferase